MHREHLPLMLLPRPNRKLIQRHIEQLDRTIARRSENLVLVRLGPRDVKEGILRVETRRLPRSARHLEHDGGQSLGWLGDYLLFLGDDALGGQVQDIESSVTDEAKICRGGDC